jgi:hypothetical protein
MRTMYCVVLKDSDQHYVCGNAYVGDHEGPVYFDNPMNALKHGLIMDSLFPEEEYEVVKAIFPDAYSVFDTLDQLPLLVFAGDQNGS